MGWLAVARLCLLCGSRHLSLCNPKGWALMQQGCPSASLPGALRLSPLRWVPLALCAQTRAVHVHPSRARRIARRPQRRTSRAGLAVTLLPARRIRRTSGAALVPMPFFKQHPLFPREQLPYRSTHPRLRLPWTLQRQGHSWATLATGTSHAFGVQIHRHQLSEMTDGSSAQCVATPWLARRHAYDLGH